MRSIMLIFFSCTMIQAGEHYFISMQPPTRAEIHSVLAVCSYYDAQLALNLLYYSYERSMSTCTMQEEYMHYLRGVWNQWHSCAQRRFNPSRLSHNTNNQIVSSDTTHFHTIATRYAQITNDAYHNSQIVSPHLRALIEQTRAASRSYALSTIWDTYSTTAASLFHELITQESLCHELEESLTSHEKTIAPLVLGYCAAASFDTIDQAFLNQSDMLFTKFISLQEMYNTLWNTIETTRAAFYYARYEEWYMIMKEYNFPAESFVDIFTQQPLPVLLTEVIKHYATRPSPLS